MVANACNCGIKEAEVGKLHVQSKPRLQSKPLIQKPKRQKVTVTVIWPDFLTETVKALTRPQLIAQRVTKLACSWGVSPNLITDLDNHRSLHPFGLQEPLHYNHACSYTHMTFSRSFRRSVVQAQNWEVLWVLFGEQTHRRNEARSHRYSPTLKNRWVMFWS